MNYENKFFEQICLTHGTTENIICRKNFRKSVMIMNSESVVILSGENVVLDPVDELTFVWREPNFEPNMTFEFSKVYEIRRTDWSEGVRNCVWQLHGRTFQDMSCLKGKVIKKFYTGREDYSYQLRQYEDGKKFLFYSEEIPTFDSGDREWDSMKYRALFCDDYGVNLIHCHEGYKLPRISICVGLKKASAEVMRWLIYIGCPHNNFPKKI